MKAFVIGFILLVLTAESSPVIAVDSILIKGTVTAEGKKCVGTEINIYDGNKLVHVILSNSKGRFEIHLLAGSRYTVEFTHPVMVTKRLVFDLRTSDIGTSPEPFECDVLMYTLAYFSGMSSSILDFPMAILEFNSKKGKLELNTMYTDKIQELYQNMLIFAENTDRTIWKQE
ncbi:MAG: hypothetical protein ACI8TS_000910 [Flavobacteriales bacterium]|jgi:hypothetical protein